jgi:hypothetical protein
LFLAAWTRPLEADAVSIAAFDALRAEIGRTIESSVLEARLIEGEVLVIDHGRILQGRKALEPNSRRRLRRFRTTRRWR